MKYRLVVRIDNMGPEGQALAPSYRTVVIDCPELDAALECGSYSHAGVVGVEVIDGGKHETTDR